ncbi:MAG TPA: sigma-70 family RNA polymerase sigma factor [Acidimicrobiia bacterium]|nr:sigma-70 family RNA polymerase sigma factor [Acidimicrobiia bacterium]
MEKLPAKVQRVPATVQRAAEWSETAFREVYSRYIRPVNAYILRRVRNHHDAEDLTAQVFVQALDHLDPSKAGTDSEVASWLFTSARNATANHSRRRRYVVSVEELPEEADESEDPSQAVLDEEVLGQVLDAIAKLPEERRRALVLRFVEQLPHAEIAEVLGRTETSARVLLHRTLATLRKEVS